MKSGSSSFAERRQRANTDGDKFYSADSCDEEDIATLIETTSVGSAHASDHRLQNNDPNRSSVSSASCEAR